MAVIALEAKNKQPWRAMEKVFRDPVHDFIVVDDPLLLGLIDSPEFQRLRRIHQLGAAFGTYHGAEHSRFSHSLGVMHIMRRILQRFRELGLHVDDHDCLIGAVAALLHDIGHGPFSHLWEKAVAGGGHEVWGLRIITGETAVSALLREADPSLPDRVARVLKGDGGSGDRGKGWLRSLISSQLDADRMDYLLRDALYSGVSYGRFDLGRLIHTMALWDGKVVIKAKGLANVEEYLLARYFMYWRVYYHKTIRAQEAVFVKALQRACALLQGGRQDLVPCSPALRRALLGSPTLEDYLFLDDHELVCAFKCWRSSGDAILADLTGRFLDRRLLKPLFREPVGELAPVVEEAARHILLRRGYDPDYYLIFDRTREAAYEYYSPPSSPRPCAEAGGPVLIITPEGVLREVSEVSPLIRSIASEPKAGANIYVPGDCRGEILAAVSGGRGGT